MEAQTITQSFDENEMKRFNSWTKEQVYEAYLSERQARMNITVENNNLKRQLAEIRHMASK